MMNATPTPSLDWLPTADTPVLQAGEIYIEHGIRVCIVHGIVDGKCTCGGAACKPGKHPVIGAWQKKIYRTAEEFRDAFGARRVPEQPNIGIVLGEQLNGEHWLAIDNDDHERLKELEEALGPLPPTLSTRSGGGGSHHFYALGPDQDPKRMRNRTGIRLSTEAPTPGVDAKWTGGQIVVSPSLHVSGSHYTWATAQSVATLPQAWFDIIAEPVVAPRSTRKTLSPSNVTNLNDRYIERVIDNAASDMASRGKGERNSVLFSKTCTVLEYCAGAGLSFDYAISRMRDAGVACGLPIGEVNLTLRKCERQVRSSGKTRTPPAPQERFRPDSPSEIPSSSASDDAATDASTASVLVPEASDDAWRTQLTIHKGEYENCLSNVITVLRSHPAWKSVLQYDMFRETVVFTRPPPCRPNDEPKHRPQGNVWLETDDTRTQAWFQKYIGFEPPRSAVTDAVQTVAEGASTHPVREYLDSLVWDGDERLPTFLANYFGAKVDPYTAGIGLCWMISGIARIMRPGCQVDYMLVLEGPQGLGKSSGVRALLPQREWFSDTGIVIGQKDSYMTLHGLWIYGFDELDSIRGNEITKTKSFLTSPSDRLRPPYGRRMRDYPRQTIFVGTTNENEYFRDRTGNRRFWPVACSKIDVEGIVRDRDQLWAEAKARYERDERWWPDATLARLCSDQQQDRVVEDPWETIVADWLESDAAKKAISTHGGLRTLDILSSAVGKPSREVQRSDQMRIGEVLRSLGWERQRRGGHRERSYVYAPIAST